MVRYRLGLQEFYAFLFAFVVLDASCFQHLCVSRTVIFIKHILSSARLYSVEKPATLNPEHEVIAVLQMCPRNDAWFCFERCKLFKSAQDNSRCLRHQHQTLIWRLQRSRRCSMQQFQNNFIFCRVFLSQILRDVIDAINVVSTHQHCQPWKPFLGSFQGPKVGEIFWFLRCSAVLPMIAHATLPMSMWRTRRLKSLSSQKRVSTLRFWETDHVDDWTRKWRGNVHRFPQTSVFLCQAPKWHCTWMSHVTIARSWRRVRLPNRTGKRASWPAAMLGKKLCKMWLEWKDLSCVEYIVNVWHRCECA